MKLGKTLKNIDNVLAKVVEISSLLMKKSASFLSKICPVF